MTDLAPHLDWHRLTDKRLPAALRPYDRIYQAVVDDTSYLEVFVGREPLAGPTKPLQWHLSIAFKSKRLLGNTGGRLPTWEEIHDARYKFIPDDVTMGMLLPPRAEYVNVHKTTMHLHEIVKP